MDLLHLKYAVEVAATKSISKAAENLFMGQPNLSRAIRELEDELQIKIFQRTSHGVSVTVEGEEFLRYAQGIVSRALELESIYKEKKQPKRKFSLCAPRASYIAQAFTAFACENCTAQPLEFYYKETNSMKAIQKVLAGEYNLAVIRYQTVFDKYFRELFEEKRLTAELVAEFDCLVTISRNGIFAENDTISLAQLADGIEILHSDPYVPSLPMTDILKASGGVPASRSICVFERATQFSLLEHLPDAFMWLSRVPQEILDKYGLVQLLCTDLKRDYKDVLICRAGYKPTEQDNAFITALSAARRRYL